MQTTQSQQARQKAYFNRSFRNDSSAKTDYTLENWRQAYIQRIFNFLGMRGKGLKPSFKFLDVGVGGSGYTVVEAARRGASAWGTDLSAVAVQTAGRLAGLWLSVPARRRCHFVEAPAEKLPFKSNTFNAISCVAVLEHVVEDQSAMKEIARVLKPGGKAYIMVPNVYDRVPWLLALPFKINDIRVGHLRQYSPESLSGKMRAAGLVPAGVFYHGHLVKLWQFFLTLLDKKMNRPGSEHWWRLENKDWQDSGIPSGTLLSMVFEKPRRGLRA